jgi:hypothetical protein
MEHLRCHGSSAMRWYGTTEVGVTALPIIHAISCAYTYLSIQGELWLGTSSMFCSSWNSARLLPAICQVRSEQVVSWVGKRAPAHAVAFSLSYLLAHGLIRSSLGSNCECLVGS